MKKVCMIVQDRLVKGGIAAVISGYYGSQLEKNYNMIYVESYKDGGKIKKICKAIGGYFQFIKVICINKPDLIHIHSSFGPSFYRKIPFIYMASWAKIPVLNHVHGADFTAFYENASTKKKQLIKRIYGKCSRLIALSEEWKQLLKQIVPEEKITVIENYSVLHREALTNRANRECNNRVLFLGELGKRKGCYDIPSVVQQVIREIPNVKFILAGEGTSEDEVAIKKLVAEKGISKNIEFPGWLRGEEKEKALCDADLFFLPSYNEGMPMSVLDAMGYGLPIVSTEVGGVPKIVREGENGYCCKAGNSVAMANAIQILLLKDDKRVKMGEASLEIVKKEYSFEQHIDKIEKVYESLLGK